MSLQGGGTAVDPPFPSHKHCVIQALASLSCKDEGFRAAHTEFLFALPLDSTQTWVRTAGKVGENVFRNTHGAPRL